MNILVINKSPGRHTLADFYIHAFWQLGHKVDRLDLFYNLGKERIIPDALDNKNCSFIKSRFSRRVLRGIWDLKGETHHRLILKAREFKPDLILAMEDIGAEPDAFREIRGFLKNCRIFCYLPDPLQTRNKSFLKTAQYYDHIFTFSRFQVPVIYWFGARAASYLPFAYSPLIHKAVELSETERGFYGSDVSYMGTWQPYIEVWVDELAAYNLKIWGNQWYKLKGHKRLKYCWQGQGIGLYEEIAKIIGSSKIIFNVIRHHNGNGHSMKTFEIPACGGFMLSNRTDEQLEFFPENTHTAYFSTKEELKEKLEYYLKNESERRKISLAAYEAVQPHTYTERAKKIIEIYQKPRG